MLGINRVLWGGVILYARESHNCGTIERYGHGTPDDWPATAHNVRQRTDPAG